MECFLSKKLLSPGEFLKAPTVAEAESRGRSPSQQSLLGVNK